MEVRVGCLSYAPNTSWDELVAEIRRVKNYNPEVQILTLTEAVRDINVAISFQFIVDTFAHVAQETHLYLAVPFVEESNEEKKYNSVVVFNPAGQLIAHHRAKCVEPPLINSSESVQRRYNDRKFPTWFANGTKSETCETEYGRIAVGCGGYELELIGSLQEFQHFDASIWLGGIRYNGIRTRLELRDDIRRIEDSGFSRGALVASCWSPVEGGLAINIIWDFSSQGSSIVDIRKLTSGVFTSFGTIAIDEQDMKSFYLPKGLTLEQLQNVPPEGKVRVAAAQHSSDMGTIRANADKMILLARQAAASHAKFIVYPEAALTGYLSQDLEENWLLPNHINKFARGKHPEEYAIQVVGKPDDILLEFDALARELNVYLVVPFVEKALYGDQPIGGTKFDSSALRSHPQRPVPKEGDILYYNTALLISPHVTNPDQVEPYNRWTHYRKRSPWPAPEISWAQAGQLKPAVAETPYGKVGLGICFDIHTILPHYESHNLWTLLYPVAWVDANPLSLWFHSILPKRIREEQPCLNVVACNWSVDRYYPWLGYGFSTIYEHTKPVACSQTFYGNEIVYADLKISS